MSNVDREKAFDRAVDLTINQDRTIQSWTGRYVTIQTSLALAEAALIAWKGSAGKLLASLIALLGIALVNAITAIITREYEWQSRYVDMVKRAEEKDPYLYQIEYEPISGPNIKQVFLTLKRILIPAWIIVIALLWLGFLK